MNAEPDNLLTEWARLVAGTLARAGVRRVVVSPGSRSTPYLLALAGEATIGLESVLDERSAAFVALGMARATGEPAALLTTSGTAPAHAYPAVIEASHAEVPLVVLSADRPVGLRGSGAPQTIDQTRLFGEHARAFVEIGDAASHPEALRHARRALLGAVAASLGPRPGPVQINLPARKPLEPREPTCDAGRALHRAVDALLALPVSLARPTPRRAEEAARVAARIARADRPVIVVGPLPAAARDDGTRDAVLDLAEKLGAPVFAEATSQLRFASNGRSRVDALDLLLRVPSPAREIDLAIEVGGPPTSMAYDRHLATHPELARVRFEAHRARDPQGTAEDVIVGNLATTLSAVAREIAGSPRADRAWLARLAEAERAAWSALARELDAFGEVAVARALVGRLPEGAILSVGNSLPVRALDRALPARDAGLTVLHQRGANGIEGLVSGAAGASLATGRPAALLLGDLAFQHDVGGLAAARRLETPLAIVVVNNSGGRIFEQLPLGRDPRFAWIMPRVITPQAFDAGHAAAAFGAPFSRVTEARSLETALDAALARPGASVIEAVVAPSGYRDEEARILAALSESLTGGVGR